MMGNLGALLERLKGHGLNLLIISGGRPIYSSDEAGMAPLLRAIDRLGLEELRGSTVVDRIVGKAAALLISHFRAGDVYAGLLSREAVKVLKRHGVRWESESVADRIMNRDHTDICPFEKIVLKIEDPREGYERLRRELRHQLS